MTAAEIAAAVDFYARSDFAAPEMAQAKGVIAALASQNALLQDALLQDALAQLIGSSDPIELRAIELGVRLLPAPAKDKAAMLNGIQVLLAVLP